MRVARPTASSRSSWISSTAPPAGRCAGSSIASANSRTSSWCTSLDAGEARLDAGAGPGDLEAVGITNQRETVVVWDPATGEPLHRALVWQDRRTAERCDALREAGHEALIRERTGLVLDPYFSGTKIEWLLRTVDGLEQRTRQGRAVFGTVDSWLLLNL